MKMKIAFIMPLLILIGIGNVYGFEIIDLKSFFMSPSDILSSAFTYINSYNVDFDEYRDMWMFNVKLISFFFVIVLCFNGFEFINSSYAIEKRYNAKENLKKNLIAMIFLHASFYLYSLLNNIISQIAYSAGRNFVIDSNMLLDFDIIAFGILTIVLMFSLLLFYIRIIIIVLGIVLLPFVIFCTCITYTRRIGMFFLNIILFFNIVSIPSAFIMMITKKLCSDAILFKPFFYSAGLMLVSILYIAGFFYALKYQQVSANGL